MTLSRQQELKIRHEFNTFLLKRARKVESIRLSDLAMNPIMLRVYSDTMNLDDSGRIIGWRVDQYFERGASTSFGSTLKNIALNFLDNTDFMGIDGQLDKNGRRYFLKIDSGPETTNQSRAGVVADRLNAAAKTEKRTVPVYGMCYGKRSQINSRVLIVIEREGKITIKIGRDLWAFISGDKDCVDSIYALAAVESKRFRGAHGRKIADNIRAKKIQLTREFKKLCEDGAGSPWAGMLDNYL